LKPTHYAPEAGTTVKKVFGTIRKASGFFLKLKTGASVCLPARRSDPCVVLLY
jgi:hypothetical protein